MNRNQDSHFALTPSVNINRSRMDRTNRHLTSFNVGQIIPFFVDADIMPGDTVKIETSKVFRLQTLITPMMDNLYMDTYYFFVPHRLVWEHWKQFCGENTESAWLPQSEYSIPQITSPASSGWSSGTIADYFGIPINVPGLSVNALPFRAYALIMDEFFRNQNVQDPLVIPKGDATVAGVNSGTFITDVAKGGLPYIANKYKDQFTACLPAPQKGPDVTVDLVPDGVSWPVITNNVRNTTVGTYSMSFRPGVGGSSPAGRIPALNDVNGRVYMQAAAYTGASLMDSVNMIPDNLVAVPQSMSVITINQLRTAFQIQKFYEKQALGGSRYTEVIKQFFGVTSPDARLQRPEYLGGNRIPVNVNQVVQSSATASGTTPQGNTAAFSLTTDRHDDFVRSFTEHGTIIGLAVVRYKHTYQQGLERMWSRKTKFDYYWPVFANLGNQAVKNQELYAQGSSVLNPSTSKPYDEEVFGYQEAWYEYRYKPSVASGEMRSGAPQSLDVWHLADDYSSLPALSASWILEDKTNVDRVLAVTSSTSNQIFGDFYIKAQYTRPMPVYSVPGLIDHH